VKGEGERQHANWMRTSRPALARTHAARAAHGHGQARHRVRDRMRIRLLATMIALVSVAVPGALLGITEAAAAAAPTVSAVGPDTGPVTGGTVVTVTGTNFMAGMTTVRFGFTAATGVVVHSGTSLTAVAPAGPSRSVDVVVTVSGQASATSLADLFAYGTPSVTGLTPSGGPTSGGTSVMINGTGFLPGTTVAFGSTPATGIIVRSATSITALSPAGSAGVADVTVTTPAGSSATSSVDRFAYVVPSVEWISPDTGPAAGGTSVTVIGSGFGPGATVHFGTAAATAVVVKSATALTATAPPGTAGSFDVTVTTTHGTSAAGAGDLFAYGGPPSVSSITPNDGPIVGDTSVVIIGAGFTADSTVHFGTESAATVSVNSGTSITASTPPASAGSVDVAVATSAGTSTTSPVDLFAYGVPTVSAISPSVGPSGGGTPVTISGSGFAPGAFVTFGPDPAAAIAVNSATSITALSPSASAWPVDIRVVMPGGTSSTGSPDVFTFGDLEVTSVSPPGGPIAAAMPVTVSGNGFAVGASVQFGGVPATDVVVQSPNTITVTSPPEGAGVVDVTVTQGPDTSPAALADQYTYGGPAVGALLPDAGPVSGGETVAIGGSGFVPGSSVDFGATPSPQVTVDSDSLITAVAPSASAGVTDVTVITPAGTSDTSPVDKFTADVAPVVSGLSPNGGPRAGGTIVTISGSGFAPGATVSFGSRAATAVTFHSTTSLTATAPATFANAVDVTVTTPGGSSALGLSDLFASGSPSIQSVEPDGGDVGGGTFVVVIGSGFTPGATVAFGSTPATDVTVLSSSRLTAVAPAHVAGSVDVGVTTKGGTSSANTSDLFAYDSPTVTDVTPNTGPTAGGTWSTITGSGFVPDATVTYGPSLAASVNVISGIKIIAMSPSGTGPEDVVVHTPDGDSTPSPSSVFTFGGPAVTSISPDTGPIAGGTVVTIAGTRFTPDATVQFGSAPATGVTYVSPSTLTATAPPLAAGSVDVTVTNSIATSADTLNDLYASGSPSVTAIDPDGGPDSGGTTVSITGIGFVPDATVAFGFVPAAAVQVESGTHITAIAPASFTGSADIRVTNGQGTSDKHGADVYIYGPPSVVAISPSSGPVTGGTSVTVTGSGFTADAKVIFGFNSAPTVTVQSSTSLVVIAPPGSAGVADVIVLTPGGDSSASAADEFAYNNQLEISCVAPPYATPTASCPGIDLPTTALNGAWQAAQAPANTMYITDNRGDASAGWSVSAYLMPTPSNPNPWCAGVASFCNSTAGSDTNSPDAKIPSSYLTIGNVSCNAAAGNPSADPQVGAGGTFPDGSGAVSLCTAQAGKSAGTFKLGATYSLAIPPWIYAGQYQATVEYLAM
jgi:hypothetical protein